MKNLLFQGIYDKKTFSNLRNLGIHEFAFDLRPQSPNFMTISGAKGILDVAHSDHFFLIFSKESHETIQSYKNLLKNYPFKFTTVIREHSRLSDLSRLNDFYWMFNPVSEWREIFQLNHLKGVFLPIDFQDFYAHESDVWKIIEARNLDVYLHANNFEQSLGLKVDHDLKLSIDLTKEVEMSYRNVDLDKLNRMKIWGLVS
jgi:hypothetical protein